MRRIIPVIFILITLSGCTTASGPIFKEVAHTNNESVIYFYRELNMVGGAMTIDVAVNGKLVIVLANDGYYPLLVKAGKKHITVSSGFMDNAINIIVEPNKTYYVRTGGVYKYAGIALELTNDEVAKKEIIDNRLQEKYDE